MPNLSPASVRKKYMLYDNKVSDGAESAQSKDELVRRMTAIGYEVVTDRGDVKKMLQGGSP
jgi:biotin synthase